MYSPFIWKSGAVFYTRYQDPYLTYTILHNRKEKPAWLVRAVDHQPAGQWHHHRAVPYRIAPWPHHSVTSSDWSNMCACWNTQIWLVDTSVPYRIAPWHMRTTTQWRHHRSLPYLSPVTASHRGPTTHSTQSPHHCYGLIAPCRAATIAANFGDVSIAYSKLYEPVGRLQFTQIFSQEFIDNF